jgi:phosphohistidine phosphatase
MMVYLVQHGRSLPKETDQDQGLSDQGKAEVEQVASKAKAIGLAVSQIIHSGKTRAQQTAAIFASCLTPGSEPVIEQGLNPLDDVAEFGKTLSGRNDLLVVGHLPFMERLVSHLITGSQDTPVIRFRNGGVVCMEHDPVKDTWVIKWVITPEMV